MSINSDQSELGPEEDRDQDSEEDEGDGFQNIHEGGSDDDSGDNEKGEEGDGDTEADIETDTEGENEKNEDTDDEDDNGTAGNPNHTLPSQFDGNDGDQDDVGYHGSGDYSKAPSSSRNVWPSIHGPCASSYGFEPQEPPRILRVMNPDPNPNADAPAPARSHSDRTARVWEAGYDRSSSHTLLLCSTFSPKEDGEFPYFQRTCRRRRGLTPLSDQIVLNSFESWTTQAKDDGIFQRPIRCNYPSFASCPVPPTVYPSREDAARKLDSQRVAGHSQRSNLNGPLLMAYPCPAIASIGVSDNASFQTEQPFHRTMPTNPISTVMAPTTMSLSTVTGRLSRDASIPPVESAPAHSGVIATKVDRKKSEKKQWRKAQEELWASFGLTYYHNSDDEDHADDSSVPESILPNNSEQARGSASSEARGLEAECVRTSSVVTPEAHQWLLESFSASSSSGWASSQMQGNSQTSAMALPTDHIRSDGRPWSMSATLALQAASQMYPIHTLGQDGGSNGCELTEDHYRRLANRQRKLQAAQALIFMAKDDKTNPQGGGTKTREQSSSSSVPSAPDQAHLESVGDLTVAVGSLEVDIPFANVAPPAPAQTTTLINSHDTRGLEQLSGPHTISSAEASVSTPSEPRMNTEHLTFELNNAVMADERAYFERTGGENGAQTDGVWLGHSNLLAPTKSRAGSEHDLPEIPLQRFDRSQEPQK